MLLIKSGRLLSAIRIELVLKTFHTNTSWDVIVLPSNDLHGSGGPASFYFRQLYRF